MKSRDLKMKEFYRRKVERLEEKNDKLKFIITQIENEKSDGILMKLYESEYGDKSEEYRSWVIGCSIEKIIFYYPQFPSSYDTNTKKIRISYQFYNDKYVDFHGRGGSLNIHFKNLTTLLDDLKLLDKKITAHFKIHYDKPLRFGGHFDLYNFALMIQEVMGKHVVGR